MKNYRRINGSESFIIDKDIFIDTNVWIITNGPQSSSQIDRIEYYTQILNSVILSGRKIYITDICISEIFNVIFAYFRKLYSNNVNNKNYKRSQHYLENIDAIFSYIEIIISTPNLILYNTKELYHFPIKIDDRLDFNDGIYAKICMDNDLILITDDSDFKQIECDIISCNTQLCPIANV
jgi:predicted nucleic acid-binding protein